MTDENLKIFNSRGEYKMSEDETFKFAKSIALESAEKNFDDDVKNFLRKSFEGIDDNEMTEITEKFLNKNKPRFVFENLTNGNIICYAEIHAEISLIELNRFIINFAISKLEKKVDEQKKIIDELQNKLELFQKFLPDLIKAEIYFKNNPNFSFAYNNRGVAYKNLKNYSQAIKDYTQAIELDPYYDLAYYNRGLAYADLKNYSQAIEDYTEAIKLNPTFDWAYYNRGLAYFNLKNYSQAIEDYTQAIKLDPNWAKAYNNRGLAYKEIGENEKAEKDFAKARELGYEG